MTFKQTLHRQLDALERTEVLVYQRRDDRWVVVQDQHRPIL